MSFTLFLFSSSPSFSLFFFLLADDLILSPISLPRLFFYLNFFSAHVHFEFLCFLCAYLPFLFFLQASSVFLLSLSTRQHLICLPFSSFTFISSPFTFLTNLLLHPVSTFNNFPSLPHRSTHSSCLARHHLAFPYSPPCKLYITFISLTCASVSDLISITSSLFTPSFFVSLKLSLVII